MVISLRFYLIGIWGSGIAFCQEKSLNNKLLYKKVGYVLEKFKETLNIQDEFFSECNKRSGNTVGYYNLKAKDILIFNAKWRLYVYKDMEVF